MLPRVSPNLTLAIQECLEPKKVGKQWTEILKNKSLIFIIIVPFPPWLTDKKAVKNLQFLMPLLKALQKTLHLPVRLYFD